MTRIHVACEKDRRVFKTAQAYNINLLVGSANVVEKSRVTSLLNNKLQSVIIRGQNETGARITKATPGICCYNLLDGTSDIEMYGYKGAYPSQEDFIKHEFAHELWHSLINVTNNETLSSNPKTAYTTVDNDGDIVTKYPTSGTVLNVKIKQNKPEKQYGIMFMETTTDLLTSCTYAAFDEETRRKGLTVDKIFNESYMIWNNKRGISSYSLFTSLTRLLIAAYSNVGWDYLDGVARSGKSIFKCQAKTRTGKTILANTYLYNYANNPLEIEREFDKYLGLGSFEKMATKMDAAFEAVVNKGESIYNYRQTIKEFMFVVSHFVNAKKAYQIRNGLMTREDTAPIISRYNKIWNSLQTEYSTYFTKQDIDEINRKAIEFARQYSI